MFQLLVWLVAGWLACWCPAFGGAIGWYTDPTPTEMKGMVSFFIGCSNTHYLELVCLFLSARVLLGAASTLRQLLSIYGLV